MYIRMHGSENVKGEERNYCSTGQHELLIRWKDIKSLTLYT